MTIEILFVYQTTQPIHNCNHPHGPWNLGTLSCFCSVSEPKNWNFMWKETLALPHLLLEQIHLHVYDIEIVCWPEVVIPCVITGVSILDFFSEFFRETTTARKMLFGRHGSVSWQHCFKLWFNRSGSMVSIIFYSVEVVSVLILTRDWNA